MKILLLFISLTYISWGPMSTPPDNSRQIDSKIDTTVYEISPVDLSEVVKEKHGELNTATEEILVNDYLAEFKNLDEMEDPCLGNCEIWTLGCFCGESVTYQWCPCPWFPPLPLMMGHEFCLALCAEE